MAHEQPGENSHPERSSVHTVAAPPPDVTQKAFDASIAACQSALIEFPCPSPEVTSAVPTVPFPAISGMDPHASGFSSERIFQDIPEPLRHVTSTTLPVTTPQCHCLESSLGTSLPPMMASQQTMPTPIYSAPTEVQPSTLGHPQSQITSSSPHSPTLLSTLIAQANDSAGFAESITASGQSSPLEDNLEQSSMQVTEYVTQSNDPCPQQTFSSVDSPTSPPPHQQSPTPRTSPVLEEPPKSSRESSATTAQPLLPTAKSEAQSNDSGVSGSALLWHGGAAAELSKYKPTSTDENSKTEASTSQQSTPFTGEQTRDSCTGSTPLITDTNHGFPIVIYDTDEEIMEEIKAKTALYKTSRLREPQRSPQRNLRKRVKGQAATEGQWVRPQYEGKLLRRLKSAFYQNEYSWMCVREFPEAVGVTTVEAHDRFVQEFGEVCRANKAVSFEDARTLRTSFSAVSDHLLSVVQRGEDRDVIQGLGALMDEMHDHAFTIASIHAFRAGGDDSDDDTYRPSKKRRL